MAAIRIIGIVIMFLGLVLRIIDLPGYTIAFVVGALLILFARLAIPSGKRW